MTDSTPVARPRREYRSLWRGSYPRLAALAVALEPEAEVIGNAEALQAEARIVEAVVVGRVQYDPLWHEVAVERARAHDKHGAGSMEVMSVLADARHTILSEEVGEVARVLNDYRHAPDDIGREAARGLLRGELMQVAAMAVGWVACIDGNSLDLDTMRASIRGEQQ